MRIYAGLTHEERSEARRKRLVETAIHLFAVKGFQDTTVREICARASVSTRDFYPLFKDKEDLMIAIFELSYTRHLEALAKGLATVPADADISTRIAATGRVTAEDLADHPLLARVAFVTSTGISSRVEACRSRMRDEAIEMTMHSTTDLVEHGLIPTENHRLAASAIVGAFEQLKRDWVRNPISADEFADRLVMILSRLLCF